METQAIEFTPILKLTRDLRNAAKTLSAQEARFLVDSYYTIQEYRKRTDNQIRALTESGEPCEVLKWFAENNRNLENQVKSALQVYVKHTVLGERLLSVMGIGPVISAGLMAHIDITRAPTAGHIWSFAGLNPEQEWKKGEKRPWNASLKTLCWKIGESFVKVSNREGATYGRIYQERKSIEQGKNAAGEFEEQADAVLKSKNIGKSTEAYQYYLAGELPPAHIHARAKRYAVKLFLAHYHEVAYKLHYRRQPPLPYPIVHLGHVHHIKADW